MVVQFISNPSLITAASTSVVKQEVTIKLEESARPTTTMDDAVHPRKKKPKMKEPECEPPPISLVDQPMTNCYETFLNIRKQVCHFLPFFTILHNFKQVFFISIIIIIILKGSVHACMCVGIVHLITE